VFRGTAPVPGTGWFDREGSERPLHGRFSEGKNEGKPYAVVIRVCSRCGGLGGSDKWKHTGWSCYQCGGSGRGTTAMARLFTTDELKVLNERRDTQRAKKAAARAVIYAELEAAHQASAAARKAMLEADPFYNEFKTLIGTFSVATVQDEGWDPDDKRPPLPDFLKEMWKRIQHMDLSGKMVAAVQKFLDSRKAAQRRKDNATFLAEVGKRILITAKVLFIKTIYYGNGFYDPSKYLIKFETADGVVLTWFTQKYFEKGTTVTGKATVKAHNEFKGMKETQITNFRITEETQAPEEVLV